MSWRILHPIIVGVILRSRVTVHPWNSSPCARTSKLPSSFARSWTAVSLEKASTSRSPWSSPFQVTLTTRPKMGNDFFRTVRSLAPGPWGTKLSAGTPITTRQAGLWCLLPSLLTMFIQRIGPSEMSMIPSDRWNTGLPTRSSTRPRSASFADTPSATSWAARLSLVLSLIFDFNAPSTLRPRILACT